MLLFVIVIFVPYAECAVHKNIPQLNREINKNETYLHLKEERVQRYCSDRQSVCTSADPIVCAIRHVAGKVVYKQFNNSCFLFISNMCEYPGEEFNIVSGTTCAEYLGSRRHGALPTITNHTTAGNGTIPKEVTKARASLREATQMSTLYDVDTAFDWHVCPMSCPETYDPVCVCANRNMGQYFKFFTFSNHCEGDRYYCMHWQEFSPPPGENEKVQSSGLGWSYCGSSRYLMFTRFAESSSSLGHYGWLNGDYRYSHIMESRERKPGYG